MKSHAERTQSLTENLFSLEEPWRGRFLTLVAERATRRPWDGQPPARDEVVTWLGDVDLYRAVTLLLNTWRRRRGDKLLPIH